MKSGALNSKEINISMRIDGSFHLSGGVVLERTISKHSHKPLIDFCSSIFTSWRSKRVYTKKEHGYPYLSNSDVVAQNPFDSCNHTSRKYGYDESAFLKEGMVLTGRVGAIGQTAYVTKEFEEKEAMGSDNIIRIVAKSSEYSGYLYSFLSSRVGNTLLWKLAAGGVQPYITDQMVKNIPVPIFPESKQQEIHNLIVESANLRVGANRLLEEAIAYFNDKIEIPKKTQIFFSKPINELSFSWASYNNNKQCDSIENRIDHDSVKMEDISEKIFAPPMFKHIYLNKDNGNPFLTGAELTKQNPKFYRWLSPRGVKDIEDYKVKKGTLLLYKSGTTDGGILGNVFIADDNLDGVCLSDHVIRITMTKLSDAYWAYAFLKSDAGVQLLLRLATGTMIPFITPERLKELSIFRPNKEYERITGLVDKYISKKVSANIKENQAISLVEKEIESWQQS